VASFFPKHDSQQRKKRMFMRNDARRIGEKMNKNATSSSFRDIRKANANQKKE